MNIIYIEADLREKYPEAVAKERGYNIDGTFDAHYTSVTNTSMFKSVAGLKRSVNAMAKEFAGDKSTYLIIIHIGDDYVSGEMGKISK